MWATKQKRGLRLILIRMFTRRGDHWSPANNHKTKTGDQWSPLQTNFGRDIAFSADLCYNGANEKPPSERGVARRSRDGRSLRDLGLVLTIL